MARPKFSVIIPVFNNLDGLKRSIKSIEMQRFQDFEVWIIDGGSSPPTQVFLQSLSPPFFVISEKDNGIYDAINKGIAQATGEWLFFLGSGDVFATSDVFKLVQEVLNNNTPLVFGNVHYNVASAPSVFKRKQEHLFESEFNGKLWIKNTLHHQSAFYHRSLFTTGTYNLKYKVLADYDFNLRLWKAKIKSKKIALVITNCDPYGISKQYRWSQYAEEIQIKVQNSSLFFYPLFFLLALLKYIIRFNLSEN